MDLGDKLFEYSVLLWGAGVALICLSATVAALYKGNRKLTTKLVEQSNEFSERLMKQMAESAAQLQGNVNNSRDKDDRYNLVLTGLIATIKEIDPGQHLAEVRHVLEAARADLSRIANNQIIVANAAGVPSDRLQFPKP